MNKNIKGLYENYPLLSVVVSNLITFSIYTLGALILSGLGWIAVAAFLFYCLGLEIRLLKISCVDCYYYGKLCFSGRGMICSFFFKKGDPQRFLCKQITWVQILPDFLVALIPLLAGIYLSIIAFNWLRLGLMLLLIILAFPATGYLRSHLACLNCKQRELGCPASELFGGKK
jgi:hypothetical protein